MRNGCVGLMYNGLAYRSTEASSEIIARALAVESAAFKLFKEEESADYKKKIRSLFSNLKNKANKELRRGVLSGDIAADRFVAMTDEDLKSEELRKKELELEKENMKKAQVPMAEKSISDSLECGRCKKKKVSYTQAQTRSADEPMTTFCECMNCGHRWKVSTKVYRVMWYSLLTCWYSSRSRAKPDNNNQKDKLLLFIIFILFLFSIILLYFSQDCNGEQTLGSFIRRCRFALLRPPKKNMILRHAYTVLSSAR